MKRLMLALSVLLLSTPAYSAMESFTVDPRHTYPGFEVNHMGLSTQRGRFNASIGRITLDREAKNGAVEIEIDARTVSTGLEELEKHLRSEDFFNVEKHPLITFRSSSVEFEGDSPKSVQGDLTLLGVTRPVTLSISAFNCRIHPINKKYVCGADASTTIKRSEFGMTYAVPAVSDEVRLFIQVEAFKDGQ
ncbi:MAG TPA: YceI family protein [Thermodesulfobacteriota bacterium]